MGRIGFGLDAVDGNGAVYTVFTAYGPEATRDAAADLLREGRDLNIRSVWGLLHARARARAESAA